MTRPLRVLLIEDSDDDALLVLQQLRRGGFEPSYERVDSATGMAAALANSDWDLIISDFSLPQFNGMQALELFRKQGSDIPFILVSGTIGEEIAVEAMHSGAHDYVMKQNLVRLVPAVERELAEAVQRQQRKRAEVLLAESEKKSRAWLANSPICTKILDLDFNLQYMSEAGVAALKVDDVTQLYGKPYPFSFYPDSFNKQMIGNLEKAKATGETVTQEAAVVDVEGNELWFHSTIVPVKNEQDQLAYLMVISVDTTERKQAEEMLVKTEAKQAKMVANIGDVIVIIDQDGINRYKSPNITKWFGWKPEEVVGCHTLDNVHPDDMDRAREFIGDLMSEPNRTGTIECRYRCKDGTYKWIELTGINLLHDSDIQGILGDYHDITERKRAEAERERFMAAISQAAEIIVITDVEGMIEYVNPAFEKITGYTREEVIGKNPHILKSGEHDDAFYQKLWGTLLRGGIWTGRFINKKKDGTLYTEVATISPVKDAAGKIVNFVAVKRDVTEEIKLEEQFRQAQKMQSIGQLAGGVAHDFNNLLQIINGYVEVAREQVAKKRSPSDSLDEISKAGEHAKNLVRQLLVFSRQQVIDPSDLDLNEEIAGSQKMLERLIGEHIRIQFMARKGLCPVFADKGQINQILMNLCLNARDAMPDGGRLTIKTEDILIDPEDLAACGLTRPGRYVLLSIADTGCGMDEAICKKIFDPFFTTKEVGKGTGLGLSTVYGIVKQNDGHISVYSEPGKGTVFKIYLPASLPLPDGVIRSIDKHIVSDESGGVETILVVEDDETLLKLATQLLTAEGYTVLTAKDGEEAVRVFEEHADEIDLVMTDVVMPRMGGKEAVTRMLEKRSSLRYLFVSGYSADTGHVDFMKDKDTHLLTKPYQAAVLFQKIREVLDA